MIGIFAGQVVLSVGGHVCWHERIWRSGTLEEYSPRASLAASNIVADENSCYALLREWGNTMRMQYLLGIAALGLWPGLAQAQGLTTADFAVRTTQDLYKVCSASVSDPMYYQAHAYCAGFLVAVVSYDYAISNRKSLKEFVCEPTTATDDQGIQVFVTWAAAHQQDQKYMSEPPVYGAVRALHAKWPCF